MSFMFACYALIYYVDISNSQSLSLSVARDSDITLSQTSGSFGNFQDLDIDLLNGPLSNNDLGEISLDYDLDGPVFDDPGPSTPGLNASDNNSIEVGRDAGPSPGFQDQDINLDDSTKIDFNNGAGVDSSIDMSFVSNGSYDDSFVSDPQDKQQLDLDEPAPVDAELEEEEVVVKKKRQPRKRKLVTIPEDAVTELSSKELSAGMKPGGADDIMLEERPTLFKKARLNDPDCLHFILGEGANVEISDRADFMRQRLLAASVHPLFRNTSRLHPSIVRTIKATLTGGIPEGVTLNKEGKREAEREAALQEEAEAEFGQQEEEPFNQGEDELPAIDHNQEDNNFSYDSMNSFDQSVDQSFDQSFADLPEAESEFFGEDLKDEGEAQQEGVHVGGYSTRTKKLHQYLHNRVDKKNKKAGWKLDELLEGKGRVDAAKVFYEILVLRTHRYVNTKQDEAYGSIRITPDRHFNRV